MADKTLKTRIKLRYDILGKDTTVEEEKGWVGHNPLLLDGEIAVVAIPTNSMAEQIKGSTPPQILFKVGAIKDASKTKPEERYYHFNELPWASGMSADVFDWAKKAKPGDAINLVTSGSGNAITSISYTENTGSHATITATKGETFATKAQLDAVEGKIPTIPGGSGGEATGANDTAVISKAVLSNHTLSTETKTIQGDTNSGVSVTGADNIITVKGPVHSVTNLASNEDSATYKITRDGNNQLTFTPGKLHVAAADIWSYWVLVNDQLVLKQEPGIVSLGNDTSLVIDDNYNRPTYLDGIGDPHDIAFIDDIEAAVAGAVDYLDTVGTVSDLANKQNLATKGDFVRVSRQFTLNDIQGGQPEVLYPGDLLIANVNKPKAVTDDWDIIPGDLGGTVTSITAGAGLTTNSGSNPITSSGTLAVDFGTGATQVARGNHTHSQYLKNDATNITTSQCNILLGGETSQDFQSYVSAGHLIVSNGDEGQGWFGLWNGKLATWDLPVGATVPNLNTPTNEYNLPAKSGTVALTSDLPPVHDGKLTINNGTGITGGPVKFTANQSTSVENTLSVKNWSTSLYYKTSDLKLRDNSENFIILDGGAASDWK